MTSELLKYLNEKLGVFLKCKTTKMKLAKNIKKRFLNENVFVLCNILSNTYVIQVFENCFRSPLRSLFAHIFPNHMH